MPRVTNGREPSQGVLEGTIWRRSDRSWAVGIDWSNSLAVAGGRPSTGAGVPGPAAEPGDALVLDLPFVPVRPLADYAIGALS